MPLTFQIKDAYSVMNALAKQATGRSDINVVDTASFVDAGKATLDAGYENLYNALAVLIGRTIIASRPYNGKFKLIAKDESNAFDNRIRKISFYARDNQASGMFNTDLYTNLGDGLNDDSGAGSMWEQNPAMPVERYFYSSFVWDKSHTQYIEQAKEAMTNEGDFIRFINGIMVEVQNDIETTIEAKNRAVVLDRIAGVLEGVKQGALSGECAVNLTKAFNDECGTQYTTAEILQEHLTEFLEYYAARVQIDSDRMTYRSTLFHDPLTKTVNGEDYSVLRHTDKEYQKFIYFRPFFTKAKTRVLPNIFNPEYIALKNGEGVDYWQDIKKPMAISVKPAVPEGWTESEGIHVGLNADKPFEGIIGMLFDEDAIMVNNKFTGMYATPINARHVYTNMWWHYKYGVIQDYTENAIVYYMADEGEEPGPGPEPVIDSGIVEFSGDGVSVEFSSSDVPDITIPGATFIEVTEVKVGDEVVPATDYTVSYDSTDHLLTVVFNTAPGEGTVIYVTYSYSYTPED